MSENNSLVSIIVRTKDRPKLLKRALQSIAAQTYRPIEVVLVNDGGCDLDIEEIRNILQDVSLNYVRLERNTGRAHAGNVGIENAKGEYIGFLDDDDEYYPDHVITMVSFLKQSDYKVAYADTEMVIKDFTPEEGRIKDVNKIVFSRDFSYNDLLISNYIPFNSLCFSQEALKPLGGFDEGFDLYEDWDLLIRTAQNYPFYHIKKITTIYNQWSKDLQINQADIEHMKATHLRVIDKHREKITSKIILDIRSEKERMDVELKNIQERYETAFSEKDRRILQLEEITKEKDRYILQVEESIKRKDDRISLLSEVIMEKDVRLSQLEEDLNLMRETLGWKMLEGLRKFRNKVLPVGTGRRKIYDLSVKSLKIIKNDGIKSFIKKTTYKSKKIVSEKNIEPAIYNLLQFNIDKASFLHFPSSRNFNVLFVKCEWAGLTNHYRIYNMAEYLKLNGICTEIIDISEIPSKIPYAYKFDLVIIHRIPMNTVLEQFIKTCKELNMAVIFDLDDYLFDPSIIHLIEWVKHAQSIEKDRLIEHIKQCKQTFDACDYFICPTDFLAQEAKKAGKKAYVIRNGFNIDLLNKCLKVLKEKGSFKTKDTIKIGYFSGTNTHQKDFHGIAQPILKILHEYNNVTLYICGLLDLDRKFDNFLHKVEKVPFVPLEKLPDYIAEVDINIVPLEPGNIFCEAKSELKYFYAGILKIPTIVTPTDAFRFAVHHGENGFLASTEEEWYTFLKVLIEDGNLRKSMGEKAFSHVMNTYTPEVLAGNVKAVYEQIIGEARVKNDISEFAISVNFLVSGVIQNFHRYDYLSEIGEILSKKGHCIRIYLFKSTDDDHKLLDNSLVHIIQGTENILSSDILICTDPFNSSVIAYQNRNRTANLVFLKMNEDYGEIPYQWANLFKVIFYSSHPGAAADEIENIVWKKAD